MGSESHAKNRHSSQGASIQLHINTPLPGHSVQGQFGIVSSLLLQHLRLRIHLNYNASGQGHIAALPPPAGMETGFDAPAVTTKPAISTRAGVSDQGIVVSTRVPSQTSILSGGDNGTGYLRLS